MLDFPASPTVGQLFAGTNGVTYLWNGTIWVATGASAGGSFCAFHTVAIAGAAAYTTLIPSSTVIGNEGGWYSTSTGRFTPPAGRYHIFGQFTANWSGGAVHLDVQLRKNGVALPSNNMTTGTPASYYGEPAASGIYDANGSDWFDLQGATRTQAGAQFLSITFYAFPISGVQGPPGPSGTAAGVANPAYYEYATQAQQIFSVLADFSTNTIPPNTVGTAIFTQNYTAASATHRIRVHSAGSVACSAAVSVMAYLFIDGVCRRMRNTYLNVAGATATLAVDWEGVLAAGAHSYQIRVASGATNQLWLNAQSGGPIGGGTMAWTLSIEELNAP